MAHKETALEDVLRAAAAEVSTPSVKRRTSLFRETLPVLLAKAPVSLSGTTLLVNLIFQTLHLYDDRASSNAVDDMIIKALSDTGFVKLYGDTLVQSMEHCLKVPSTRACFKLLKWSMLLLKNQFATLPVSYFSRLANAQVALALLLMDGPFRQHQTCKRLFLRIFSEFDAIRKMYMEGLRDSRIFIATSKSHRFISLILDFTSSPQRLSEHKPILLDLYINIILMSTVKPSKAASQSFRPLLSVITHEDFKDVVLPSCKKMLKRNPEIALQPIGDLLMMVAFDPSSYCMDFWPVALRQAHHANEEMRIDALHFVAALSTNSRHQDTLSTMFDAIKSILEGSEGRFSPSYQKIGLLNAIEQLSRFSLQQINTFASLVSTFLLTYYKSESIEEVKLAALSAMGSWASVSSEAIQPDVVSFVTEGLKEKPTLRMGHLKLIRIICKNSNSLSKVTSLLNHLIQVSKIGFTKPTQRLAGIYALYAISRLAAFDATTYGSIEKEKLWTLIAQSEPSVISVQLLSKQTDEDCLTCVDLLQSLLVDPLSGVREYFSTQSLLKVLLYLVCYQSSEIRKKAYDATEKVLSRSGTLAEDILLLFFDWLKQSDMASSADVQLPSSGILVKCLFLIAPYAVKNSQESDIQKDSHESAIQKDRWRSYSRLILCSHHPLISRSGSFDGVWKRLKRRLEQQKILLIDLIFPHISVICKELLSQDGLFSSSKQEQHAALCSLSTLITISPNDTFTEFEKHFMELPDRAKHDGFTENDIKGQSTEQGIHVLEEVGDVQQNITLMLGALEELAIANPIFIRGQLSHLVTYIGPLLSSPVVRDAAFSALLRLARCTPPPLCNWATDIAAAIRLTFVEKFEMVLELVPVTVEEDSKKSPPSGPFERIVNGLTVACKKGSLHDDTFTFFFPILERILLSSKKTCVRDDVLQILSKHLNPIALPRARIISVLYHVLSTIQNCLPLVGDMLNELCQDLKCNDLAQALAGVYAKEVHVRIACLTAIKCVPCDVKPDLQVSTILGIAMHDPEKEVAKLAKELWEHFSCDMCSDYTGIIDAITHKNLHVRVAAVGALTLVLSENPGKLEDILSTLFTLYKAEFGDTNWLGRQGIALAVHSAANVLGPKDLPIIMTFLMSHGVDDQNLEVRSLMIDTVNLIIEEHGGDNVCVLLPVFESYFSKEVVHEETYHLFRKCFRVFNGAVVNHVSKGDLKVQSAIEKLIDELDTPSEPARLTRKLRREFDVVPFLDHLKSVAATLFDVVIFKDDLRIALKGDCFVSLGESGLELYHLLFQLAESFHVRNRCIDRFNIHDILYIPRLRRLVLVDTVRDFPSSSEKYRHNIQDVGRILQRFRYDPRKAAAGKSDIFELDSSKSKLPPYLSLLVNKILELGPNVGGKIANAKWRSIYDLDLAGKSYPVRIALVLGVDLHYDYLPGPQKGKLKDCLGSTDLSWKVLAERVRTLKNVLDFEIWDREEREWVKTPYNGTSVQSLWQAGRNHQTHSHGGELSEKEIEAIFSFMFHVQLSKITKAIIETYEEPTSDDGKKPQVNIMEILKMK